MPGLRPPTLLLLAAAACGGAERAPACGMAAVVGPAVLLNEFAVAGQTLADPPAELPPRLVARLAAGPAYRAIAGRTDDRWMIGVSGMAPVTPAVTFGVLVLDRDEQARGVMLYQGAPVRGAPEIGTVSLGDSLVPLVGIRVDPSRIEDPRCPLFPDSLRQ